ncbi:hypothetical protein TRICHSKD4_1024 [Roseibium sp. TrichSKD4]|uniref:hypothetical protein n=1 Tax=Roseibium sp. TrichSKD4 TaxID=744980 RepID=UPI0001E56387|nr:hypothetical protein [Roseibium sp. TrichSKD4]EFO33905.1 hypothetical protein TRICHSKD4_1024 [Roseibium sp. TrichSKD4]
MSSDDVLTALHAVLQDVAESHDGIPPIDRNETLERAFTVLDEGASAYANMVDGDLERLNEALGAGAFQYELRQTALLELIVKAETDAQRRSVLKFFLSCVHQALVRANEKEDSCAVFEISGIDRLDQATDGAANIAGITVVLSAGFVSNVPY